jgi:hypothetical protein
MEPDLQNDDWRIGTDDRRAAPRRATEADAHLDLPDGQIHGVVVNISFGGAKFVTRTTSPVLATGAGVTLVVTPRPDTGSDELTWRGRVLRSERSGDDGPDRIAYAIGFDESEPRPFPGLDLD